jgi:hypothetical protein
MLAAESAVFFHLKPIRIILFTFHGIVITLFAFGAGQRNLISYASFCHFIVPPAGSTFGSSHKKKTHLWTSKRILSQALFFVKQFAASSQLG